LIAAKCVEREEKGLRKKKEGDALESAGLRQ